MPKRDTIKNVVEKPMIVLASSSPRRRELFALLGLPFQAVDPQVDETPLEGEDPKGTALRLASAKAQEAAMSHPEAIIVAADTLVISGEKILGKPKDRDEAVAILKALRGKKHRVISGVRVLDVATRKKREAMADTQVWMRDYSEEEIARYIGRGEPFDKAGGYAIQDEEFQPVARVKGCYANVMGLPLCHLYTALKRVAVNPPATPLEACIGFTGHECILAQRILGYPTR
ncbi:MAG: Maf family protein [Anaerolineae bacterium]